MELDNSNNNASPNKASLCITYHPHPILPAAGRRIERRDWLPGQTVREVLRIHGIDPHVEIVIGLNDRLLSVDEWDTICPVDGDLINVQAAVSGGGDSNPLAVIASIALTIAAPHIGAWAVGLGEFGPPTLAEVLLAGSVGTAVTAHGGSKINAVYGAKNEHS